MSVHTLPDGRVICKWYDETGKARKKYFGRGDLALEKANRHDAFMKDLKREESGEESISVAGLLNAYHIQHLVAQTTRDSDFYRIDRTIGPRLGKIPVDGLKTEHIHKFVNQRLVDGKSISTIKREISLLKAAFSWGARQKPRLVNKNILSDYRIETPEGKDVPSPPTVEEIQSILSHSRKHLQRALILGWYTGIRPGIETSKVKWSDVDFSGSKLRIVSARKGGPAIRYVSLHPHLQEYMEAWIEADKLLLAKKNLATPISAIHVVNYGLSPALSLKHAWTTAKKDAGITRRLRLYDVRHRFATTLLEQGFAGGVVSKLMGHSRADTTQRFYFHVTDKHSTSAVESMTKIGDFLGTSPQKSKPNKTNKTK